MRIIPDTQWNTSETYILLSSDNGRLVEGYNINNVFTKTIIHEQDIKYNNIFSVWGDLIKWRFKDENNT